MSLHTMIQVDEIGEFVILIVRGVDFKFRKVKNYFVLDTKVTQEQWEAVLPEESPSHHKGKDLPVESISYYDIATRFLPSFNRLIENVGEAKLPTVSQFKEYAFAGATTIYPWGDKWDPRLANCNSHCTTPVKAFPPNKLGIYDPVGNVWEILENDQST